MRGTKAERLDAFARANGLAFLRFDYSGHGESDGRFEDGTIGSWRDDAEAAVAAQAAEGPLVLVGSSMGAWIALLLAPRLGARLAGMLLLAPAPDFTERLLLPQLGPEHLAELERQGFISEPSEYSEAPNIYTKALIEDGRENLVMTGPIHVGCPVHIIQGQADPDVPFAHALELAALLPSDGLTVTLVPDGDHRLSRPEDLERVERALSSLIAQA
ncbi:alpha/beta hydrolase [Aureimonas leprariae]|uniref:Palmitoyl-protein thioesterase ABHD10, mitochondrial n=2 Tax=Plantimonas leprariae TaxID=2615207 RepID=A0A7V7TVG3_9HYPH|nr:alpha/beta hydrolase [Aureimonas leprariae]